MAKEVTPRPVRQQAIPLPKYIKPYNDFKKQVTVGDDVSIHVRVLDRKAGKYVLQEILGKVVWIGSNAVWVYGQAYAFPWYIIHDWNIFGAEQ